MRQYLIRLLVEVLLAVQSFSGPCCVPDETDAFESECQRVQERITCLVRRARIRQE